MRAYLRVNTWRVYDYHTHDGLSGLPVDIPDDTLFKWAEAMRLFDEVQDQMDELWFASQPIEEKQ
jgi:hypothetical protein